jgi:hypothetical protein
VNRTYVCAIAASLCCGSAAFAQTEEGTCPTRYDPRDSWLEIPSACERGDVLSVSLEKADETDAPRLAAAYCELDGISWFRGDEVTALICRYRGAQRRPREVIRQLGR